MKQIKVFTSPNIAFIKYWGKKETKTDEDRNLPLNHSLSLTLSKARTEVVLTEAENYQFTIQNLPALDKDKEKIRAHIERIENFLGKKFHPFHFDSVNNFPMGTGIASSASAFSAMTCAFLSWGLGTEKVKTMLAEDPETIADLARRGSGSACRSLYGPFVEWWDKKIQIHRSDWQLYDTIVIFSKKPKEYSSTEGHKYATQSPLFPQRLKDLPKRLQSIKEAIEQKNLHLLGPILETEAEEMHRIMRENPHPIDYQLLETQFFIKGLQEMPKRDFYYTLDAGPNVHLISERPIRKEVEALLQKQNLTAEIWEDHVGRGPMLEEMLQ